MKTWYSPPPGLFIVCCPPCLSSPQWRRTCGDPRIIVSGEGTVEIAPDMAILSLVVMREAPTAEGALATNSEAMTAVMKAMTGAGIAERDIQTTQFSIQPRYTRETRKADGTIRDAQTGRLHRAQWCKCAGARYRCRG